MTMEDAIQWLTDIKNNITENWSQEVAIDMAIEALQTLEAVERIKTEVLPQTEVYEDYEHATLVDIKEPLVKHDREWLIGCIKHDGFIKTDRFDEANQIILDALQFAEHFDLLKEHEPLQEVVRCKDCRYYWGNLSEDDTDEMYGECRWNSDEMPNDDDFCSYGERAEQTDKGE